jgi:single-strand DNA-binding protein
MKNLNNKVFMTARLAYDPDVTTFDSGKQLATLRLAVNEYKKNGLDWETTTHWHNAIGWGKVCDRIVKNLRKGDEVIIEGKLTNSNYQDKDGNNRYTTSIEVKDFMIKSRPNGKKE